MSHLIQSVQLRRDKFTKGQAWAWVREHHYPAHKIDISTNYYHFRLVDPERLKGGRYRTISLGDKGHLIIYYF